MKLQRYYLTFLLLWLAQSAFALEGLKGIIYIAIVFGIIIVIGIAATIYLLGRFAFKMKGKFWITFLATAVGNIVFIALGSFYLSFNNIYNDFIWTLVYTITAICGMLGYNFSHKESIKRQKYAENGD